MGMTSAYSQFHVLAVDDNLIDRKLIERILKISSFQVTTVDSGSKALEFLGLHEDEKNISNETSVSPKNHQNQVVVNLVITDYCMPGMTGYDLLKKMKESSSLKNIPVVILSSENVPSRITRCLEEGAEDFFLKPMKLSDVNKLRPHIMRAKCTNNNNNINNNNNNSIQKPEKQEKQEIMDQGKTTAFEETQQQATQSVQQQQLQQTPQTNGGNNNNDNNSKRNPLRMGFEQTGQGTELYNGLTVMSN